MPPNYLLSPSNTRIICPFVCIYLEADEVAIAPVVFPLTEAVADLCNKQTNKQTTTNTAHDRTLLHPINNTVMNRRGNQLVSHEPLN